MATPQPRQRLRRDHLSRRHHVLPDGTDVASPSAAIKELTGNSSAAALDVFVRESDGKKLRDLWDKYRSRFAS